MNKLEAKKKILKYHWEPWLRRPFFGFIMSTFESGNTKKAFKKIGLNGWEYESFLFNNGEWYQAEEVYQKSKPAIIKWLKSHMVSEISSRLEISQVKWRKEVAQLLINPKRNTLSKLNMLAKILREITTFVWAVHALEHFFTPILRQATAGIIATNVDKFIGDASFPAKFNALEQMIEEYKMGVSYMNLTKKYGWMRARDGFSRPYTSLEIVAIIKHALSQPKHKRPLVPKQLERDYANAQELVYLRMLRMDAYFELMYLAKHLLREAAKKFGIKFSELKYYTAHSLIAGKPRRYPKNFSCFSIKEEMYFFDEPIFQEENSNVIRQLKGTVAQVGLVRGRVKIVTSVQEISKVKKGDIMVTYMTSPNFLPAMKLAAGFVTNEGGLTCHAAIVAREMKKPCIIGTKVATKVLKDGDLVEVDANHGVVRKLKR